MGDGADYLTETGEDMFVLHHNGECGLVGPCPYCETTNPTRRTKRMPPQTQQSDVFAKTGNSFGKAVETHKSDKTVKGFVDLPPGIRDGKAKLTECRFGVFQKGDNEGKPYLYCAASVGVPKTFATPDGVVKTFGRTTKQMFPMCATKTRDDKVTTEEENVADALNILRLLGGDDILKNVTAANAKQMLPKIAEAIRKKAPWVTFSTSAGKPTKEFPNPRTWENWNDTCDPPEDLDDGVDDSSGGPPSDEASANGDTGDHPPLGDDEPGNQDEQEPESLNEIDNDLDLNALMERAKGEEEGSEEAREALIQKAVAAGYTRKEAETDAKSWEQVIGMIENPKGGEPEAEPWKPAKGETAKYAPWDAKSKKAGKPVDVTITEADGRKKVATVRMVAKPNTVWKDVKYTDLMKYADLISPE